MPKQHHLRHIPLGANNFLSVLEGMEGGFAIFVGIIAGLSFEHIGRELLILTAVISIVVNAINATAVRYTSEHYIDELDGHEKRNWIRAYLWPALIVFLTYVIVSTLSVIPLLFIANDIIAVSTVALLTTIVLFVAGCYRGSLLGHHVIRDGFEVAFSGVIIMVAGAVSGWLLSHFLV